jgi:hypothetical protein
MVKKFDEAHVIQIGQGISDDEFMDKIGQDNYKDVREYYSKYFDTNDLSTIPTDQLHGALQPDSLLERFAYRKEANLSKGNEFMALKGVVG